MKAWYLWLIDSQAIRSVYASSVQTKMWSINILSSLLNGRFSALKR